MVTSTKKAPRRFIFNTDCKVFEYLNGTLYNNGKVTTKLYKSCIKNLVGDSLNLDKPYYFDHIGWNIESIESFYEALDSSDFEDSI